MQRIGKLLAGSFLGSRIGLHAAGRLALSAAAWALLNHAGCRQVDGLEDRTAAPSGNAGAAGAAAGGTAGSAGAEACAHECCRNTDCAAMYAAPHVCRDNTCVALLTAECTDVIGSGYVSNDGVVIGFMDAMSGPAYKAKVGMNHAAAVRLAATELSTSAATMPSLAIPASLTVVVCDDQGSAASAGLAHLVDDLGVRAILGPTFTSAFILALTQYANPGRALLLSSSVADPNFPALNTGGLAWSLTPNLLAASPAFEQEVGEAERLVRQRRGLGASDQVRLVMVAAGDPASQAGNTALIQQLTVNKKVAIEQESPAPDHPELGTFYYFSYPDPNVDGVDYDAVVAKIVAFKPDIIMPFGGPDISAQIMPKVEAAYSGQAMADKPIWTMYFVQDPAFVDLACGTGAATDPSSAGYGKCSPPGVEDFRRRVMGFGYVPENVDVRESFANKFAAANGGQLPLPFAAAAYDSYFVLAYALAAAAAAHPTTQVRDLTPVQIAEGLVKVATQPGSPQYRVGGEQVVAALEVLRSGGAIDIEGASGHLEVDTTPSPLWPHGLSSPRATLDLWCISPTATFVTNGETYDPAAKAFSPPSYDIGACQ